MKSRGISTEEKFNQEGGNLSIHKDTWDGKYWGPNGVLARTPAIEKEERKKSTAKAAIGAASAYYGAFNQAYASLRGTQNPFIMIVWVWRMNLCYFKAFVRAREFIVRVGEAEYSPLPSDYDVAGSVFAVLPIMRESAIQFFKEGLRLARKDYSADSIALLLVKIGRTYGLMGKPTVGSTFITDAVIHLSPHSNPEASCRVYRDAGDFLRTYGDESDSAKGIKYLLKARDIAEKAGLTGAVIKIDGVINKRLK